MTSPENKPHAANATRQSNGTSIGRSTRTKWPLTIKSSEHSERGRSSDQKPVKPVTHQTAPIAAQGFTHITQITLNLSLSNGSARSATRRPIKQTTPMAKESGHWYDRTGKACHTQPVKSRPGDTRPTTLADARKLGLLPSVTGVLSILDKAQLNDWKLEQLSKEYRKRLNQILERSKLHADDVIFALRDMMARDPDELHDEIVDHAFRQVEQAADAGELIHKAAEKALQGLDYNHDEPVFLPELKATFPVSCFIQPVEQFVKENSIVPLGHEVRLTCLKHGYAGTGDLPMQCPRGRGFGDWKTRKTKPGKPVKAYDTQVMQIAAYHFAHFITPPATPIPKATGFNLFISTTEPGRIDPVWYDSNEIADAYQCFTALCKVWQFLKGYNPTA
jgi:hypothetical protein